LEEAPEITITEGELAFLRRLAPLIVTPRAAKRFFNTYQLVRVSLNNLEDSDEYQPLLILLALVIGTPGLSAAMVRSFISSGAPDLLTFLREMNDLESVVGSDILARKVARITEMTVTTSDVRRWLPVVARFSFQPGLAEELV
jgi:hypothetical protein